ncbi:hypothetical protein BCR44DRAFT_1513102 [Catenaria anguillulae PL171]|uniref:Uncharacterized protein n=1 Tax=Catenaria anguillulae PL171 TaxID=765915 RepID=A0A1Y2HPK5_9FUNG|nr:hypothetical protein BCR44DRAFT_1513102 [Catenaria anguillulae PL171]
MDAIHTRLISNPPSKSFATSVLLITSCAVLATIAASSMHAYYNNSPEFERPRPPNKYLKRSGFHGFFLCILWTSLAAVTYQHYALMFPSLRWRHGGNQYNPRVVKLGLAIGGIQLARFILHMLSFLELMAVQSLRDSLISNILEGVNHLAVLGVLVVAMHWIELKDNGQPISLPSFASPILVFFQAGQSLWTLRNFLLLLPNGSILGLYALIGLAGCTLALIVYGAVWIHKHARANTLDRLTNDFDLGTLVLVSYVLLRIISTFVSQFASAVAAIGLTHVYELVAPAGFGALMLLMTLILDFVGPVVYPRRCARWLMFVARFAQELFTMGVAFLALTGIESVVGYCAMTSVAVVLFDSGLFLDAWTKVRGVGNTVVRFQRGASSALGSVRSFVVAGGTGSEKGIGSEATPMLLARRSVVESVLDERGASRSLSRKQSMIGQAPTRLSLSRAGDGPAPFQIQIQIQANPMLAHVPQSDFMPQPTTMASLGRSSLSRGLALDQLRETPLASVAPDASPAISTPTAPEPYRSPMITASEEAMLLTQQVERGQLSLVSRIVSLSCFVAALVINPRGIFAANSAVAPEMLIVSMSIATLLPWPLVVYPILRTKLATARALMGGALSTHPDGRFWAVVLWDRECTRLTLALVVFLVICKFGPVTPSP